MKHLAIPVLVTALAALGAGCSSTPVSSRIPGYLTTPKGQLLLSQDGQCWRTAEWRPALAIARCDPEVVAREEKKKEEEKKKKLEEKEKEFLELEKKANENLLSLIKVEEEICTMDINEVNISLLECAYYL